ncbi:hypothetical protein Ddc_20448 [Ditylenchus destructor]|nr:hypothetical protein Ddc_20448 [Ditylenchus destructor]
MAVEKSRHLMPVGWQGYETWRLTFFVMAFVGLPVILLVLTIRSARGKAAAGYEPPIQEPRRDRRAGRGDPGRRRGRRRAGRHQLPRLPARALAHAGVSGGGIRPGLGRPQLDRQLDPHRRRASVRHPARTAGAGHRHRGDGRHAGRRRAGGQGDAHGAAPRRPGRAGARAGAGLRRRRADLDRAAVSCAPPPTFAPPHLRARVIGVLSMGTLPFAVLGPLAIGVISDAVKNIPNGLAMAIVARR